MREWLSGRASPCQGERREFESRLPLQKNDLFRKSFFLFNLSLYRCKAIKQCICPLNPLRILLRHKAFLLCTYCKNHKSEVLFFQDSFQFEKRMVSLSKFLLFHSTFLYMMISSHRNLRMSMT